MKTELGKFLAKLRVDRDEQLKDMAKKLNVGNTFICHVEMGVRKMPLNWETNLPLAYRFSEEETKEFLAACDASQKRITINLTKATPEEKKIITTLARAIRNR